jgi:hypothetical protein
VPIGSNLFAGQANAAANVNGLVGGQAQAQATIGQAQQDNSSVSKAPIALMAVIVLYLVWAILIRHEKLNSQLSPANVAVNLHNIVVVGLTAMLFILLGKIATAKAVAAGVPGVSYIAQLFQAT